MPGLQVGAVDSLQTQGHVMARGESIRGPLRGSTCLKSAAPQGSESRTQCPHAGSFRVLSELHTLASGESLQHDIVLTSPFEAVNPSAKVCLVSSYQTALLLITARFMAAD